MEARARAFYSGRAPGELVPTFEASKRLEQLVQPHERLHHPLPDDPVSAISKEFEAQQLLELVARARRRLTGSSFPREYSA